MKDIDEGFDLFKVSERNLVLVQKHEENIDAMIRSLIFIKELFPRHFYFVEYSFKKRPRDTIQSLLSYLP